MSSMIPATPMTELGVYHVDASENRAFSHYTPGIPLAVDEYGVSSAPFSWRWTDEDGGTWVSPMGVVVAEGPAVPYGDGRWYAYPDWTIRDDDGGRLGPFTTDGAAKAALTTAAVRWIAAVSAAPRTCEWCGEPFNRRRGEQWPRFVQRRFCRESCSRLARSAGERGCNSRAEAEWYASRVCASAEARGAARALRARQAEREARATARVVSRAARTAA
ncbi:MAG: hypothetical protein DYG90_00735 [Chloroflexi bacterium CFX6]|nr:hypothetical protein [Chloroflexi bacterium CFX6]